MLKLQRKNWYRPKDLGNHCDIFYTSKGESYDGSVRFKWSDTDRKGFHSNWGKQYSFNEKKPDNSNSFHRKNFEKSKVTESKKPICYSCGSDKHFMRECPKNRGIDNKRVNVNNVIAEETETEKGETVAARVNFLCKVIPRQDILDKLCKLETTSISVDGKLVNTLVDSGTEITVVRRDLVPGISVEGASTMYLKGIFGPAVKCPLVYVPLGIAAGDQGTVVHQQVLYALAEVLEEDVLLPPDVLNMLKGARSENDSLARHFQELSRNSENLGETGISSGTLQEKAQDNVTFEKPQREFTSWGNEVGAVDVKDREVTTETDKGSMITDNFCSGREKGAELALARKHATEGKSNYYDIDGGLVHRHDILEESIGQLVIPNCKQNEVVGTPRY
ncbi:hypothetical protein AVEN_259560-1 [Araneus ventricosus]|uniref:CCHC-type domain-containing protein n=1 Tax=Araneus ventricosus TaxID=182803 RepID=A0A4Y2ERA5_ARAVE|nr:hypothetical protein AVEN_259560-1 [Araneus ventricosus]